MPRWLTKAEEAAEEEAIRQEIIMDEEAIRGECRHGCNGDCIVMATGSDVCNFLCHPGLERDEEKASRVETYLQARDGA
jgi:hypothetical protein